MFDLKITGDKIVDGTGTDAFAGEIAIKDPVLELQLTALARVREPTILERIAKARDG